jgi:N-acetylglucosaminyl-diphospho-decaprenol L-rhamnosyltransferase
MSLSSSVPESASGSDPASGPDDQRIAVVTVSYGSEGVLGPFLDSLTAASAATLHVVVADNKVRVQPNQISELSTRTGAAYLPMASNRGYGHAVNEALKGLDSRIEWVVISNPDVIAEPRSIDILLETLKSDPLIASVGPRILTSQGTVYPSARSIPTLQAGVGHALFAHVWPRNPWTRAYRLEAGADPVRRDAGWLSGAFLVVRRSVLEDLQGFDEGYFMYFEDVDLGYRIGTLGLRNVYEPRAVVVHTGAHSTSMNAVSMMTAHHDSAKRFLSKKYPGPLRWPVRRVLAAGLDLRAWLLEHKRGTGH